MISVGSILNFYWSGTGTVRICGVVSQQLQPIPNLIRVDRGRHGIDPQRQGAEVAVDIQC